LKNTCYILFILLTLSSIKLLAQDKNSISIKAQATVVDKSGIELVTIKDIDIDESMAHDGIIYVSAKLDPQAAVMVVKGRSNAKFRVSFVPVVEIVNTTGTGTLLLQYEIYGYPNDNQSASEPLDAVDLNLQIGSDKKYYFWVGGRIDISKASPGSYYGNFTIEIEYI